MADPDFKLRRGPGSILLAQSAFLPSVISSFFTQYKVPPPPPRGPALDPPFTITQIPTTAGSCFVALVPLCNLLVDFPWIHLTAFYHTAKIVKTQILMGLFSCSLCTSAFSPRFRYTGYFPATGEFTLNFQF